MSKLSVHINKPSDAAVDFVAGGKPVAVAVLLPNCDLNFIKRLRQVSPSTKLIGRYWDDPSQRVEEPERVADVFWNHITNTEAYKQHLIEDWTGPNEIDTTSGDNIYGLLKIDRILAGRMRLEGRRYWMFSTAERQPPDVDNWNWTRDVRFLDTAQFAHGYCVHVYWWPRFGDAGDPLRHQRWYAQLPPSLRKSVFIKECGPDAGVVGQHHKGWYSAYGGNPHVAMADFAKWDRVLQADPAVLAASIFCLDARPTGWWDFALNRNPELMNLLIKHIQESHEEPNPFQAQDLREKLARHPTKTWARRRLSAIDTIVIHHDTFAQPITSGQLAKAFVNKGWPGMAYHFHIRQDGTVDWCLYLEEEGGHCYGHNAHTIGICLNGCFTQGRVPTREQEIALSKLVGDVQDYIPTAKIIKGHRELRPTACPGGDWFEKWRGEEDSCEELRKELRNTKGAIQAAISMLTKWT